MDEKACYNGIIVRKKPKIYIVYMTNNTTSYGSLPPSWPQTQAEGDLPVIRQVWYHTGERSYTSMDF